MAAFDRSRTLWTYTDDQGDTFAYNTLAGYASQSAVLGGVAAAAGLKAMPRGRKARKAIVLVGSVRRHVPCFDPTATAFTTVGTSVDIDIGGTATAAIVQTSEGERHRGVDT